MSDFTLNVTPNDREILIPPMGSCSIKVENKKSYAQYLTATLGSIEFEIDEDKNDKWPYSSYSACIKPSETVSFTIVKQKRGEADPEGYHPEDGKLVLEAGVESKDTQVDRMHESGEYRTNTVLKRTGTDTKSYTIWVREKRGPREVALEKEKAEQACEREMETQRKRREEWEKIEKKQEEERRKKKKCSLM